MFHLGAFESSLRNSDGGKKYAARKRNAEVQLTHKSCTGKSHGHGVLKNKEKDFQQEKKKKKISDQCVPKSDESLADSAVEIDHKVPGSSQEPSVDGLSLSESDNEKLKWTVSDNCSSTRGGDNEITSVADVFEKPTRSRSWEGEMKPKVLKIRGPFGSLVDLSQPSERNPFGKIERVIVKELPDVSAIGKTETKEHQSEGRLFEAIEALSKRLEEEDISDAFEDLEVEQFENVRVSKLFESYFKDIQTKEEDIRDDIEALLTDLQSSRSQSKRHRNRSLKTPKKKDISDTGKLCRSHVKDEDIIKNIIPDRKEFLKKAKKNLELERKWIPGGILKRSAPASDTVDNVKLCGGRSLNNQTTNGLISKSELIRPKPPQESSVSIKLTVSGKTEKKSPSKWKNEEFLENIKKESDVGDVENIRTEKDSKLSKQKISEVIGGRRPSKNEILAKSNEARKLQSKGSISSPRSSVRRKDKNSRVSIKELNFTPPNNTCSKQVAEVAGSEKCNQSYPKENEVRSDTDKVSNLKNVGPGPSRPGKVKQLISNFEKNSNSNDDSKYKIQAAAGPYKKFEDFKKAKTEEELTTERALLESEKLWLVHKGGFTAVRALPNSQNQQNEAGKIKVKVEKTNEVLEVDDDDLEKANPSQLDKIEDICQLRYINESSVLYILRQRFGNNLIHTYAAGNLIVINPQCTLSIYNEKVAALFRGCKSEDMPPHIYAMAQTTYRSMLSTRKDQSIVLMGRSGSGKTHNFRHILSYLLHSAGSVNKVLTIEKLNALNTILEAFGNARTCLNVNATRCTNLISLDFDQTGQIASISVQMLMLEKQRIGRRPDGEGTFNVFYWLLAGAEGALAKQLLLDSTTHNNNLFITALYKSEDRQRAVMELSKLSLALKALGVTEKECFVIWSILAAIFHLGNAGTVRVGTNKWQFADPVHSSRACRLLGTTSEELCQTVWNSPASPSRTPSPGEKDKSVTGAEALEGFVVGLYSELVNVVNNLINRSLTTNVHSSVSLVVVDSPGVQNPSSCGQQRGATFNDLCHNYVQERLHLLFHNVNLVAPHDRYTQEHIDVNTEEIYAEFNAPNQLVSILDKSPPSGVLKTSQTDLREIDRRGLLFLLDEESLYPNSSDDTFLDRLFTHYGGKEHQMFIRKSSGAGHFVIQHFQGTNPVTYNAHGLLKASKENPLTRAAASFLQESTKEDISEIFIKGKGGLLAAGAEGSQSLRRVSSIRRTCSVAVKRKSISLQVKFTTDSLIETLRRTRPRFVFCMLPHHNAGNTEIIPGPATGESALNVPLLRSQIRGAEILPAVRMFKQGFPEYYPHGEFRRRFRLLAPGSGTVPEQTSPTGVQITINGQSPEALDEARAVEEMLLQMDVDVTSYRIGLTQIFFRAGILAQLESQRDEKLADLVIQLQSRCRGYIARKKLAKLKVQDLAVRCIQRNVRKLMQVREWPWWRLYVKVTPLLNVHRTEEELTAKIQELEALKSTLEKVELERNQLKLENDKLETKNTLKRTESPQTSLEFLTDLFSDEGNLVLLECKFKHTFSDTRSNFAIE